MDLLVIIRVENWFKNNILSEVFKKLQKSKLWVLYLLSIYNKFQIQLHILIVTF